MDQNHCHTIDHHVIGCLFCSDEIVDPSGAVDLSFGHVLKVSNVIFSTTGRAIHSTKNDNFSLVIIEEMARVISARVNTLGNSFRQNVIIFWRMSSGINALDDLFSRDRNTERCTRSIITKKLGGWC